MNRRFLPAPALLAASLACAAPGEPRAESSALWLVVGLDDGSRIIGIPESEQMALETPYGAMAIGLRTVDSIELPEGAQAAVVHFRNGDRLRGSLDLETLGMETLVGRIGIPVADIATLETAFFSNLPVALRNGLVLHFTFEDDEGNRVTDGSGRGNEGRAEGAARRAGRGGSIITFDSTSHISVPDHDSLDPATGLTILAWIRLDTLDAPGTRQRQTIVSKHHGSAGKRAFEFLFEDDHDGWAVNRLAFNVSATGNPHQGGMINSDVALEKDRWYHVAAVCDPGSEMRIHIDGAEHTGEVVYQTSYPPAGIAANDLDLRIGLDNDFKSHFLGSMDEVMIYNRALSAGEIRQIHERQK